MEGCKSDGARLEITTWGAGRIVSTPAVFVAIIIISLKPAVMMEK